MENEAQFGINPSADAQLDPRAEPRASEDSGSSKDSVRVQVHDATTPLLQQPNGARAMTPCRLQPKILALLGETTAAGDTGRV
ncbi:hypothetical protein PHISP_05495 [Aspergillus sp. HF37]|nr:hypothetical protein PHISP_05495 [Aspergillus sp. HF37]